VALFALATVVLTGSHNLTLLWSLLVIGPIAVLAWLLAGASRPSLRAVGATALLTAVAAGVNGWFLLLDLAHSADTYVGANPLFNWEFTSYFDNLGVILDPVRNTPAQSGTFNLTIAAPVGAFVLSLVLLGLAWPSVKRMGRWWIGLWLILLAAMIVLVAMMVMPGSWWEALGSPFTLIQFPYRLAGWLLVAIAVQLAVSLRFARNLSGRARGVAIGLAVAFVALTVVQAAAEMYPHERLDGKVFEGLVPRRDAFVNGPTSPPVTWYDPNSYADSSQRLVEVAEGRTLYLPTPSPGQTRLTSDAPLPAGKEPVSTNVAGGPYVVRVEGLPVLGRSLQGTVVVKPPADGRQKARVTVVADAGALETFGSVLSIVCIVLVLALIVALAVRRPASFWHRSSPAQEPAGQ
jgi:hypothetical protein